MIRIQIGTSERSLDEATTGWMNQQINRRREDGVAVCVTVRVQCAGIDLRLTTPACTGGEGGRRPNQEEQRVIDLWKKRGLLDSDFTAGNLVAFLRQLEHLVGVC